MKKNTTEAETISKLQEELNLIKNAYNELHGSEQRKMLALDDVPVFELTIDSHAYITRLSKGFEKVMGAPVDEYIGRNFTDFLADADDIRTHDCIFPGFAASGYLRKKRWRLAKSTGEVIDVLHSARAIYDDNGNFVGGVGFILDISDTVHANQALLQSENEKRVILDAMSDGVLYIDPWMNVIWANRVTGEVLGVPVAVMKGRRCTSFCPGAGNSCDICSLPKALLSKSKQINEARFQDKVFIVQAHPVIGASGEVISIVMVLSDITESRLMEKQILEMSNNERRRIGHDLHDGMGQMLTALSMMSSSLMDIMDSSRTQEYDIVKKIVKYSADTQILMRNILDGLCPIAGDIQNLDEALSCMASSVESSSGVACVYRGLGKDIMPKGAATVSHLYLIMQEAVNNAVKHSGCSLVSINVSEEGNILRFVVADNGKGIDTGRRNDNGHGLRIMRYRASIMGALLRIERSEEGGTLVTVTFDNNRK